jgi:3-carboxy-cis,cis-muconate cycloisomerase
VEGLRVDADRMLVNLAATKGLAQAEALAGALATNMGRDRADAIVAQACRVALERGADLAAVVRDNQAITGELGDAEIAAALDPRGYLGSSDILITRAIARFAAAVDD